MALLQRYASYRYWLPPGPARDSASRFRERATIHFSLLAILAVAASVIFEIIDDRWLLATWDTITLVALVGGLHLMRRGRFAIDRMAVALCALGLLNLTGSVYAFGGSPAVFVWLIVPGLLAVVLVGARVGVLFAGFGVAVMIGFTAAEALGVPLPPRPAPWIDLAMVVIAVAILCALAVFYDRARSRTLEEVERLRDRAEQASRAKSHFLANMSHEIRTPMNGVIGMTDLLRSGGLSPEQAHTVDVIQRSGQALLRVIDDILDFTKVEAGMVVVESVDFDPRAVVREVVDLLTPSTSVVRLGAQIAPEIPRTLRGDPLRLRQVLLNIVGNALKFTERGSVDISLRVGEPGRLRLEVVDTGVGIQPQRLGALFASFTQADASTTRRFGGTGLGLAISRGLVEAMGGTIGVTSAIDQGSTFAIDLPLVAGTPGAATVSPLPAPSSPPRPLRVLVAEDNVVNQQVVRAMLRRQGHGCEVVADGRRAVEAVTRDRYDLVLMDCHMPELDGRDATRLIRALPGSRGRTPIVAVTASALEEDRVACMASGMDDVLTKPLTMTALARAIGSLACEPPRPSPAS